VVVEAPGCVRAEVVATVPAGGVVRPERLELRAGGAAEGDVIDARGDAVAGAVVARADAPTEAVTGAARSGRRGEFALTSLPEGDVAVVAWHPTLGRSLPTTVRVIRGTVARGVRVRFERDLAGATRAVAVRAVAFRDVAGAVEVQAVGGGTAADRAGLRPGDRVVTIGAEPVANAAEAERRIEGAVGDDVVLEVDRDGARRTVRYAREVSR
jgi:regulator of sigma E protease